jgi:predicted tellurium resistance membrane protein TerC
LHPNQVRSEFLSAAWWSALLAIILIDLVLAGDNAASRSSCSAAPWC